MTCPVLSEIGPIEEEWDTQSLVGVLSVILSFCCMHRRGGLHVMIGRCPHGPPNKQNGVSEFGGFGS